MYRINLSAVVSKYVGETEKNLNMIFEEASKSLCILFFDEADALFGKRTEVKDSQDKYQNMEAAFLLQKMEDYDGISILATNYQQNLPFRTQGSGLKCGTGYSLRHVRSKRM